MAEKDSWVSIWAGGLTIWIIAYFMAQGPEAIGLDKTAAIAAWVIGGIIWTVFIFGLKKILRRGMKKGYDWSER